MVILGPAEARPLGDTASDPCTIVNVDGSVSSFCDSVPGPLPIVGAAAAFSWSRKLRARIKEVK